MKTLKIEEGTPVDVKNRGENWLRGCIYKKQLDDGFSKVHLVEDWNGSERRFHFVRPLSKVCPNCGRYAADTAISCSECNHLFEVCQYCAGQCKSHLY